MQNIRTERSLLIWIQMSFRSWSWRIGCERNYK